MQQEDFNEMMRLPGEVQRFQKHVVSVCPECGERYCGDGIALCVECAANQAKGVSDA